MLHVYEITTMTNNAFFLLLLLLRYIVNNLPILD